MLLGGVILYPSHLTREHMRLSRGRFQAGISLTGREGGMRRLARGMVLPLPFQFLVLAFCQMVHLFYGYDLPTSAWQAMGLVYAYIVHITWGVLFWGPWARGGVQGEVASWK